MSYRDQLDIGMTEAEIVEILGAPSDKEEGEVSAQWKWESIIEDDNEYEAVIGFFRGKVTSISFSSPGSPPADIAEALFSARGRSVK